MVRFESASKSPSESRSIVADFVGLLASGVTIAVAAASQLVYSGAASELTLSSATISGSTITVPVSDGTAGVIYQLIIQATLSDGQILRMSTLLAVTPDAF
jgi:hypothetical protein